MKRLAATLLVFLATALPSFAEEMKPLAEADALRLEKAEMEIQMLLERAGRIRAEAQRDAKDMAVRDGAAGWQLDLPNRAWVKPNEKPKEEPKP